jgi:hypothetical protein
VCVCVFLSSSRGGLPSDAVLTARQIQLRNSIFERILGSRGWFVEDNGGGSWSDGLQRCLYDDDDNKDPSTSCCSQ